MYRVALTLSHASSVAIVGFERGRIRSQRILWDYATLTAQLGIPAPARPAQEGS